MEFVLEPLTITKELILNRVSEETLMEHYLGVPVRKGLVISPLRKDTRPTASFYRSKTSGRLIFKDFGSNFSGDFVSVVMCKFNCSYGKALQIIANDFGIIRSKNLVINKPLIEYSNTKFEDTSECVIQVEIKEFDQYELDWWARYGITLDILKKFHVYSCKNVFLNGNLFHVYRPNQLVFGYYGGIRGGLERWKVYYPRNKKYRFIGNWKSIYIQGYNNIPENGEWLCITKSLKDCLTLYSLGIPAIAPNSETCYLTDSQHKKVIERFTKVAILYDNDYTGICRMNHFRKEHPELYPCWINRLFGAKDISDFYKKYGRDRTITLIEDAKEKINKQWEYRKEKEEPKKEPS